MNDDYMKHVSDVSRELERFGIGYLTGEADNLARRGLFDYSQKGYELLCKFFSIQMQGRNNWNGRVGDEPAVGSVMLTWETARQLLAFALVLEGHEVVVEIERKEGVYISGLYYGPLVAWRKTVEIVDRESLRYTTWQVARYGQPTSADGTRNVHGFSGREE